MKKKVFLGIMAIISMVIFLSIFGNCPNPPAGEVGPTQSPSATPNLLTNQTPGPTEMPAPDVSRKLEVTASVSGGAIVNETNEIWIIVSASGMANINKRITTNGGTVLIPDLEASVSVRAIYDANGGWDPAVSSSYPAGTLVELYNDVTVMDLSCTTTTQLINIDEGATESISILLEERNLIDTVLETAGTYTIEVYADNNNADADSRLALYDNSLQLLRYNDDTDPETDNYFSKISYNLNSGTYYVKVYAACSYDSFGYAIACYNDGSRPGADGNNGDGSSPDDREPGNDAYSTTGDSLTLDVPIYRNIESMGDEDWFTIVIP